MVLDPLWATDPSEHLIHDNGPFPIQNMCVTQIHHRIKFQGVSRSRNSSTDKDMNFYVG